jgi:hypothetical protein
MNDKISSKDIIDAIINLLQKEIKPKFVDDDFGEENKYNVGYGDGWNDCLKQVHDILVKK